LQPASAEVWKESDMNRTELERPFEAALIKTRRGTFGQQISYVEGAEYIRRLNDAFEAEWSFEVVEHHVYDAEVVVIARLSAGGVTKMAFGGSSITTSTQTGEVVSLADDLKAAATDALKKASTMLGVGLGLYSDPPQDDAKPAPSTSRAASRSTAPRNGGNRNDRLTQRQLAAIWSMGRALGIGSDEMKRRTAEVYGVPPEQLSRADASTFIGDLQEALGGNGVSRGAP
jgi:hypothetical protein